MTKLCHCGRPLHYTEPSTERLVSALVAAHGEDVRVVVDSRVWLVPRHYIALHGLKAAEIESLGFTELLPQPSSAPGSGMMPGSEPRS